MCSVVTRAELGLHPADQPKASVLFLGPTGVGKTELTKQIAKFIFGKELLYRFDMSEFLHLDQVKLFVGDETGQTGRLGTVLSEHSQGILLFDEIEKAHNLIWDLFLQMIGDARITLADHKTYDLSGLLYCLHKQHRLRVSAYGPLGSHSFASKAQCWASSPEPSGLSSWAALQTRSSSNRSPSILRSRLQS